jgi:tRNA1(Val) A37 N6-methylase TrmN6
MPTADTFDCKPLGALVRRYLRGVSIDPFARNKTWATHTNDLNPQTAAQHHMDAADFLRLLVDQGVQADVVIFDPPYSPRQIKECYDGIGKKMAQMDAFRTHWKPERDAIGKLLKPDGVVLSFGWNTIGMGTKRGFEPIELVVVCHGPGHNDTLGLVERRAVQQMELAA